MFSSSVALVVLVAATPTGPEVTLEQAVALALQDNTELKVMRSEVDVSQAALGLAHPWSMPELRVQFNNVEEIPTGQFQWYAGLSWKLPNPWEWSHGLDAAEAKLLDSRFDLAARTWRVVKELRLAWLDLSGAAAHEQLARETVEVRRKLLQVLRRRLEQGGGTQVELNLAQLGETDARQEQLRWQSARLKGVQSIAFLVGQPVTPLPATLADSPPPLPELEQLEARLERHPVLEALRARVAMAKAEEQTEAAKRLPWPELQARVRNRAGATPSNNDFQLGLTVPLGVTPAPKLAVARATAARNQAQLDAQKAQSRSELRVLLSRAEGLRDRWRDFEQDYRATLTSHRQLQARVLADGTLDPTLLLTADRQALELEHKRLEVQLDLARTLVELEAVAGPP
jgi:outer membrane protein TolC